MKRVYASTLPLCLVVATALLALGCDPGYRLRPVAWMEEEPGHRWSRDFEGFSLRTLPLGGFIGEWWLHPTLEVFAISERVTLKSASLQTAKDRYPGMIDPRTASVAPGGGRLGVHWEFGRDHPAPEVLGERAEITLEIDVGSRLQTVGIEFERTSCC